MDLRVENEIRVVLTIILLLKIAFISMQRGRGNHKKTFWRVTDLSPTPRPDDV